MSNIEKLNKIFCEVFGADVTALGPDFNKNNIDGWDSVHQLSITSSIEDTFDIMLDPEDIIGCDSYENAKKLLIKYEVEI